MLILKPYAHLTIWGGSRLARYTDDATDGIGHLYTVRGNKDDSNIIINGDDKGKTLYDYFVCNKSRWGMECYEEFPVSIALVDARENLSVQVHPTKEIAAIYEKIAIGKNESFYILEKPEIGCMINGCKCDTSEQLQLYVDEGKWNEIIDYLPVEKGDYVYVTAGTLHAMTKGALTYEIEENCTYTYRLYDYDRVDVNGNKRPLDVEKSITSIDVNKKSSVRVYDNDEIVEEKYATKLIMDVDVYENDTLNIVCLTLIEGGGVIDGNKLASGMSIILESSEKVKGIDIKKAIVARIF